MTLYYRLDNPDDVRDLGGTVEAWAASGNPKAALWAAQPAKPSDDAQWIGGQWVQPPPSPVPDSVEARQLREWLITHGHSIASIDAAIDAIEDSVERELTRNQWEFSTSYTRRHPMFEAFVRVTGLTPDQIDQAFREAATL